MSPLAASAVLSISLGALLLLLGRWGLLAGDRLVPGWRSLEDREHLTAVYRRGSWACLVVGALMVVVGVIGVGSAPFGGV